MQYLHKGKTTDKIQQKFGNNWLKFRVNMIEKAHFEIWTYLYTENQGKGGNKLCSATRTHLAGCQFLPDHFYLTEGTRNKK